MNGDNGSVVKMEIIGCSDVFFSQEVGRIQVQFNPTSLKYKQKTEYGVDPRIGVWAPARLFYRNRASEFSFDFTFDDTGVAPLTIGTGKKERNTDIKGIVRELESVVYLINNEIHRPNFLILNWGSFIYKGQLTSLDYDYTLFRPDGSPLRVKITMGIEGYLDPLAEAKQAGRSSPDLTRRVRVTAGDTLAGLCLKFYGDASYCTDVARVNDPPGFRYVEPGTELVFPPLKRK